MERLDDFLVVIDRHHRQFAQPVRVAKVVFQAVKLTADIHLFMGVVSFKRSRNDSHIAVLVAPFEIDLLPLTASG